METKTSLTITFVLLLIFCISCNQTTKEEDLPVVEEREATEEKVEKSLQEMAAELESQGYQIFLMKEDDTTYLMQQYFLVFLKRGLNRDQDSVEVARLQEQHLAHLSNMARKGYASLIGPMGDTGDIRGIVVFNTPTQEMADSLARLDPMVQAGRLEVEVRPWWTVKGGSLK